MGNAGVLLRAYFYAMVLGREGMIRVGEYSTLAANYLLKRLEAIGCQAAYPERRASHEFILTFAKQAKDNHVTALDIAKRLLDYNQHAPTIYFPPLVPECFLIEPTETETKEAMGRLRRRHGQEPGRGQHRPGHRHPGTVHPARAPAG